MKKHSVLITISLVILIGLASCDHSVRTSALTVDMANKASITTFFYAELDHTQLGLEYAPDGTRVIVSVNYNDLNPAAGSGSWKDTLLIQNGSIEVEVPVSDGGSNVMITPDEFIYAQVQPHNSNVETVEKVFRTTGINIIGGVRPGQNRFHEITYQADDLGSQTEMVDIRFQGWAYLEDHYEDADSLVHIPSGTEITLFTDEWAYQTTVGSEGRFEAGVPASEAIQMEFTAQKTITSDEDTAETRTYRYMLFAGPYQNTTPVLQVLDFGAGELWE